MANESYPVYIMPDDTVTTNYFEAEWAWRKSRERTEEAGRTAPILPNVTVIG